MGETVVIWSEKTVAGIGRVRECPPDGFPATPGLRALLVPGERRPRLRAPPTAGKPGAFLSVIDAENRERRTDTEQAPLRMICAIAADGLAGTGHGTGFLVGPRTVVTAAHVLRSDRDGFIADRAVVTPGCEVNKQPFGRYTVEPGAWAIHPDYRGDGPPGADVAVLTLPRPVVPPPSFFGLAALTDAALADRMVNIGGYPKFVGNKGEPNRIPPDELFQRLYVHADRVLLTDDDQIFYDVDTFAGQSGAPVLLMPLAADPFSGPTVVGIHTRGTDSQQPDAERRRHNSATRITGDMLDFIKDRARVGGDA